MSCVMQACCCRVKDRSDRLVLLEMDTDDEVVDPPDRVQVLDDHCAMESQGLVTRVKEATTKIDIAYILMNYIPNSNVVVICVCPTCTHNDYINGQSYRLPRLPVKQNRPNSQTANMLSQPESLYQPLSLKEQCARALQYRQFQPRVCPAWNYKETPDAASNALLARHALRCTDDPCPQPIEAGMGQLACPGCGFSSCRIGNWPVDKLEQSRILELLGLVWHVDSEIDILKEIIEMMVPDDDGNMCHHPLKRRTIYRNSEIAGLSIAAGMMKGEMLHILFRFDLAAYMKRLASKDAEVEYAHERLRSVVWSLMQNTEDIVTADDLVAAIDKGDDEDGRTDPDTSRHFLRACCYPHSDQLVGSILPTLRAWSDARKRFMDACSFKWICADFVHSMMYGAYASIAGNVEEVMASTERKRKREDR